MSGDCVLIKTYQVLKVVGEDVLGYRVQVSFKYPPHHLSSYAIVAQNDKVAADKGLRRFMSDVQALNTKSRK